MFLDGILLDTICEDSYFRSTGKIYNEKDNVYLWGGYYEDEYFEITGWDLNECNLRYGLGRERFPALITPKYIKAERSMYHSVDKCIVLHDVDTTKIYPFRLMETHEVINEVVNGMPVLVAYCVLVDLAAVYEREYCGEKLTFGASGYTYFDSNVVMGIDGFLLWDRESESLWWPLIDRCVSGAFQGQNLNKFDSGSWELMYWSDAIVAYPDAIVLEKDQSQLPPINWPSIESIPCD